MGEEARSVSSALSRYATLRCVGVCAAVHLAADMLD